MTLSDEEIARDATDAIRELHALLVVERARCAALQAENEQLRKDCLGDRLRDDEASIYQRYQEDKTR